MPRTLDAIPSRQTAPVSPPQVSDAEHGPTDATHPAKSLAETETCEAFKKVAAMSDVDEEK